jgi:hypothetical protein
MAPVAIAFKIARKPMIDRAAADPNARTYGVARDATPLDMKRASRMF